MKLITSIVASVIAIFLILVLVLVLGSSGSSSSSRKPASEQTFVEESFIAFNNRLESVDFSAACKLTTLEETLGKKACEKYLSAYLTKEKLRLFNARTAIKHVTMTFTGKQADWATVENGKATKEAAVFKNGHWLLIIPVS